MIEILSEVEISKEIIAALITATAVLIVGAISIWEYRRQVRLRRAIDFLDMRDRYEQFEDICTMLEENSEDLATLRFEKKRRFLGFYEELAFLVNSGLMKREVAYYMFGYYAIMCCEKKDTFWIDMNYDSPYWAVFKDFAKKMQDIHLKETGDQAVNGHFKMDKIRSDEFQEAQKIQIDERFSDLSKKYRL